MKSVRGFVAVAIGLALLSMVPARPAVADQVVTDASFGSNGKLTLDFAHDFDQLAGMALQPDGKIVMAGSSWIDGDSDIVIARLNSDGTVDDSFGDGGAVVIDSGNGQYDAGNALALQPDGKLVVAAQFGGVGTVLLRLDADGSPDSTFGVGGAAPVASMYQIAGLALQPDGRIGVAGSVNTGYVNQSDAAVARFLPDGTPDASFGTAGSTILDTGSSPTQTYYEEFSSVARLDDGSFLAVGSRSRPSSGPPFLPRETLLVRLTSSGALDPRFNGTGYRLLDLVSGDEVAGGVLPDSAGRAVVSLVMNPPALARVLPDGTLDPSFGSNGLAAGGGSILTRDAAGRIVTARGGTTYELRRFSADGVVDLTFNGGSYQGDVLEYTEFPVGLAVQSDGRVLVGGFAYHFGGPLPSGQYDADWFVARLGFAPDPPPPPPPAPKSGYWLIGQTGVVYPFGDAKTLGNINVAGGHRAVDIESTPDDSGYWAVDDAGTVTGRGTAHPYGGNPPLASGETVTSLSATPDGSGYWLFTSAGRVWPYGTAKSYGDMTGRKLNGPVLDSVPTPDGHGYYMVGSDGGVFTFGDARFVDSMARVKLNAPVRSLVPDPDGSGYWLVAGDGGVFAFDAPFRDSMGGKHLNKPIIGMVPYGNAYLMVASDGGIFNFATDRPFLGSMGAAALPAPIVSMAAVR